MRIKKGTKILIIKPSSLGDIVHSLPLLNRIKKSVKDCTVHWIVAQPFQEILEGHPMIDRLWSINKDEWKDINRLGATLTELKRLFRDLKAEDYDLVIDLQGLLRSGIIAKATWAKMRVGFTDAREGASLFYTHKVKSERNLHAVERYLKVAEFLGLKDDEILFPFPPVDDFRYGEIDVLKGRYAVIVPGARWQTKRWPSERFGELASMLPLKTVVIGGKSDITIAENVIRISKGKTISFAGKTGLKELLVIIKKADFIVTNDSGPMHIAAALRVPVFAIFGPTDPIKTGPYGEGHTVVRNNAPCSPCRKRKCDDMRCIKGIETEMVYESIKERKFWSG